MLLESDCRDSIFTASFGRDRMRLSSAIDGCNWPCCAVGRSTSENHRERILASFATFSACRLTAAAQPTRDSNLPPKLLQRNTVAASMTRER